MKEVVMMTKMILSTSWKYNKAYTITELKKQDNVLADILNRQAK